MKPTETTLIRIIRDELLHKQVKLYLYYNVYDTLDGKRYEKHYTVNEIINNEENLTESRFVKIKDVGIYNDTVNDGDVMVQLTVQYDDTTIQITTGIDRCLQILDE